MKINIKKFLAFLSSAAVSLNLLCTSVCYAEEAEPASELSDTVSFSFGSEMSGNSLSLGYFHSGCITEDGSLYMWGDNALGQLGNGERVDSSTPIKIMDNVKAVSLGHGHSACITEDGSLYMWGNGISGQLGNGTTDKSSTPIKIMENVKSVSLGQYHSGCITEDGSLYMWGYNGSGQLGNGTKTDSSSPIKIMDNVKSVRLGQSHSSCITADGSLYMWGDNGLGQLGNGTKTDSSTPIKIMENVKSVSLGGFHSSCITADGSLYMWGFNLDGELGDGTKTTSSIPIKIMDNVKSISLGYGHSGCITEGGSLYMWGENYYGKLGNGTNTDSKLPVKIMDNVKSASLGHWHSGCITEDGSVYMWGYNKYGQLGNGTTKGSNLPVKITIISEENEDKDPVEQFVDRLYTLLLDRNAEADGLADWTNRLKTGTATSAEIVYGIVNSQEFSNKGLSEAEVIDRLYKSMLGRDADASGKEYWLDNLAGGLTITGIINGFSGSQEFGQICASYGIKAGNITDCEPRDRNIGLTGFVSRMYTKALGRNYDVDGLNDWTNRYLTSTATTANIAYGFIFSEEFLKKNLSDEVYVETLYATFFDRPSDATGKADWLDRMHTQGYSREMVLDGFLEAPEFITLREGFGV